MKKIELQKSFVYGPIQSRRLGVSLGINLLPTDHKICSFNCVYCQYGFTKEQVVDPSEATSFPEKSLIVAELEQTLQKAIKEGKNFDYITFAGNGEPTLYPFFSQLVDEVIELRDRYAPKAGLALLSNSSCSQLHEQPVVDAVRKFDRKIFKLDAGTSDLFAKINQPHPSIDFDRVVSLLRSLYGVIIQTLFVAGDVSNCTDLAVENLIICYKIIKPQAVQIYSLDREPADMHLKKVSADRLERIKKKIVKEIPLLPVDVFS